MLEAIRAKTDAAFDECVECEMAGKRFDDPEVVRKTRRWAGLLALFNSLSSVDWDELEPHDPLPTCGPAPRLPGPPRRRVHVIRPRRRERRDAARRGGCRAGPDDDPDPPSEHEVALAGVAA